MEVGQDGSCYTDFGAQEGAEVGDRLVVYQKKEVRHPRTGEVMGVDKVLVAELSVVKVFPRMSSARVVQTFEGRKIARSQVVRPKE